MRRHIESPIKLGLLASTIAALSLGCVLDLDKLDAGQDDDSADDMIDPNDPESALECLIGSEFDALGDEQSSWTPQCASGVVCADGWGHDGDPLPIAWTTHMEVYPPDATNHQPRAIGLLENGSVVVAVQRTNAIGLEHFEPGGVNFGGYTVDGLGSVIHNVEIDSDRAYVTHGDDLGTITLSTIDITSQQVLWETSFAAHWVSAVARGGGKLALVTWEDPEPNAELVVLDLDGNTQWSVPVESTDAVAFSPSGDRIALGAETTRVYSADDGELLDEFVHGAVSVWPQATAFLDEDQLVTVGATTDIDAYYFDGWLSADSLVGDISWEHVYNRASSWCPDENDEYTAMTNESLAAVTRLPDGSLVAIGTESFMADGVSGSHPWVARFSATGEFLGNDRGLWDGHAIDGVAGPDGSVVVLITDGPAFFCESLCEEISRAYAVRKYSPPAG